MSTTQKKMYSAEIRQLQKDGNETQSSVVGEGISQQQYQELLDAINSVREDINNADPSSAATAAVNEAVMEDFKKEFAESLQLKSELEELSRVILDTRREIASLNAHDSGPKIHAMTDQLDAVVGDTEGATNAILEAVEVIEDKNESLQLNATDPDEIEITEGISNAIMKIYEACNFQDITGQRISKVVGTLKFVEDRIAAMIDILGGDGELAEIETISQPSRMDGEVELSGPTVEGHEISQDEIDALFD
ncbi:protein phosphatase CheZ [Sneathiella aquimaris]|uniref:protein phosphatase CheZ n=1 Tax=Sneathiella aquimaris TaxID=2599305 RepID=UPI00146ED74E|nr:protein phosphatase CheZ [Sneathiella aquimaris]